MSSDKNVYQRIHAVMNDMSTIAKNGRNDFHKYDYATEADYVHALRPLLQKHGLVIIPSLTMAPILQDGITQLAMKFTIVNVDKPEEKVESLIPAQGQDKGDKGVYKALTGAKKYFAALTFMVATGDDPEKDEKAKPTLKTVEQKIEAAVATVGETSAVSASTGTGGRRPSFRKNVTATASVGDDI